MTEPTTAHPPPSRDPAWEARYHRNAFIVMMAFFLVAPFVVYPVFLMKALCFALFACAFNLLIGFGGLLSFGHAMFLGIGGLHRRRTRPRSGASRRSSRSSPARRAATRARASSRACSPSAARASTSR